MKIKVLFGLFFLIIFVGCGSNLSTDSAAQTIKKAFQLTDKETVDIQGVAEESKDVRIIKFTVNKKPSAAKMRKYDQGWQLDEVQTQSGIWAPISSFINDGLLSLEINISNAWEQVANVYNRRSELVPTLLTEVGELPEETGALNSIKEALKKVHEVNSLEKPYDNSEAFFKYAKAQADLSSALSAMLVRIEKYPKIRSSNIFLELQSQLEGTENRITVERQRYNTAVQEYTSALKRINTIPGKVLNEKPYFKAEGGDVPPKVNFN